MAAVSSCTAVIPQAHFIPSSNNASRSFQNPRAEAANVAATPASVERRRRTSSAINIPSILYNILHLHPIDSQPIDCPAMPASSRRTPTWSPKDDISGLREELHGPADWSRLVEPLHPGLRREIIKYGEFSQATYDSFDSNPFSEFCGSCLYGRHRLLPKLGLARHGYQVTDYLYAMSHVDLPLWLERSIHADAWSRDSNWMGFVSVSDDAESRRIGCRDITVAWRGTVAPAEWFEDAQGKLEPLAHAGHGHSHAMVERGFLSMYRSKCDATRYNKSSASEQAMVAIKKLVDLYRSRGEKVSLTVTGHSLGGALALLNAHEAATEIPGLPVSVFSFGSPRVGNEAFGHLLGRAGVKVLRVVVKQDVVPKLPGILFNEGIVRRMEGLTGEAPEWVYAHAGVELGMDVRSSPFLKQGGFSPAGFHSLETYLHLVDGYVGSGDGFRRDARRDVALVNKACGMLKEELRVPECWSQLANKGMVCNAYGRWGMPERDADDIPSPLRKPCVQDREGGDHLLNNK